MGYKSLKKLYYQNKELFESEFDNRFTASAVLKTGLFIHPFDRGERIVNKQFELFYTPLVEHELLKDKIFNNSFKIQKFIDLLPDLAKEMLLLSQIIEEIKSTNDIEGVQSTRKEIGEAVNHRNSKKDVRFKGIVNMYMGIGEDRFEKIEDITRIRDIYDELFRDDIPKDEQPDGNLFRKNVVYIGHDNKCVHQGNPNEETIIRDLNKLVMFMNNKKVPFLLKCVISHYYFEYIHPFYDGNGRMGRFLMSNYISRKLDQFTGITISNAVIHSKNKYEQAFSEMSNPRNKGEVTFFVQSVYELIIEGQSEIISSLEEATAQLSNVHAFLEGMELDSDSKHVLFILFQHKLFDVLDRRITDIELVEITNLSRYKINRIFENLEEKGYVNIVSRRPLAHELSSQLINELD